MSMLHTYACTPIMICMYNPMIMCHQNQQHVAGVERFTAALCCCTWSLAAGTSASQHGAITWGVVHT